MRQAVGAERPSGSSAVAGAPNNDSGSGEWPFDSLFGLDISIFDGPRSPNLPGVG